MSIKLSFKHKSNMLRLILIVSVICLYACTSPENKANEFYENGMRLLEKGELDKANIEFRNALQIDRKMTKALWGQVLVAEKKGDLRQTFQFLSNIIAVEPEHIAALVKLGRLYLIARQLDKSLEISDRAMSIDDQNISVLILRAAILLQLDDKKSAVKIASDVIKKDPYYYDALIILATERIISNKPAEAMQYLDQGLSIDDKNITLQLIKIQAFENLGEIDLAVDVFRKLISYYPASNTFSYMLVQLYLRNNRTEDAEKVLRGIIKNNPGDIKAKINLVNLLRLTKDAESAQKQLEIFTRDEPDNYDLKFALIQFYISRKIKNDAFRLIDAVISDSTDDEISLKARGIKAGLLLNKGKRNEAEIILNTILNEDKDNETGLILKASIDIDRQKYDEAISALRLVINNNPKSSKAYYFLAKAYNLSGSPELADKEYYKSVTSSNYSAVYGLSYAEYLLKRNLPYKAERVLMKIINVNPKNIYALEMLAQTRLSLGDWIGARDIADKLKRKEKKSSKANQIESAILAGKKNYDESITLLRKTYLSTPGNIHPLVALVKTYILAGKTNEAAHFLRTLLKVNPVNSNAWLLLGKVETAQGNISKAIQSYNEVIKRFPENPVAYHYIVANYIKKKDYKMAKQALDKGLSFSPNSFVLLMTQANLHEIQTNYEESIKIYMQLIEEYPDSDIVTNNLVSLLIDNRSDMATLKKAHKLAQRFKQSNVPQFKDTYGWASYKIGNHSEANRVLQDVVETSPNNAIFHYHLGMSYVALDDKLKARSHLESALSIAGDEAFLGKKHIKQVLQKL